MSKTAFENLKQRVIETFPDEPGIYIMRGAKGEILYIGKAGNLRRRVSSYFILARHSFSDGGSEGGRAHDGRIEKLMQDVRDIEYKETDTALEALILESKLIKKERPVYNIREQDDKSFLYVAVTTRETFPRVLLVRGKDIVGRLSLPLKKAKPSKVFGPFTSSSSLREAMRILRRIFLWSIHPTETLKVRPLGISRSNLEERKPCFDYQVGLCPGTCIGTANKKEYRKNIARLIAVFEGKKKSVIRELERSMERASNELDFEKAAQLRKQIFALRHIQDIALVNAEIPEVKPRYGGLTSGITSFRIEGYDISNISGTSAVGAMVVFRGDASDKNEYRKFKIKTVMQSDDVGMLKEVLRRRFKHHALKVQPSAISRLNPWALPNLILIDGGRGQVSAARKVLDEAGLKIPIVGIAKGPERKKNEFMGKIPEGISQTTLVRVRDEAHRFAIAYHRKLRSIRTLE